jgi:hypothetical protein
MCKTIKENTTVIIMPDRTVRIHVVDHAKIQTKILHEFFSIAIYKQNKTKHWYVLLLAYKASDCPLSL